MVGTPRSGNRNPKSIIEKYELGGLINEGISRGLSYNQICQLVKERRGIVLNHMNVCRWIKRNKDKRIQPYTLDKIGSLKQEVLSNTLQLIHRFENLAVVIKDTLERPPEDYSQRAIARGKISDALQDLRDDIFEHKIQQMHIFDSIEQNSASIRQFLIDVSKQLCQDCSRKIARNVSEYEKQQKQ